MTIEAIMRDKVRTADAGSYFIPHSVLVMMGRDELEQAEEAANLLLEANPDYVFSVISEIEYNGISVHWRRVK